MESSSWISMEREMKEFMGDPNSELLFNKISPQLVIINFSYNKFPT